MGGGPIVLRGKRVLKGRPLIDELNAYTWKPDKYEPEDGHDHCINSGQYAWLPFKDRIGGSK